MSSSITFQKRVTSLLTAGMDQEPAPEIREKLHLAFLINCLEMSMMLIFAAEALFRGNIYSALVLFILTVLVISNIIIVHYSGNDSYYFNFSVWLMLAMCVYLLSTGGVQNTGILWCYIFPLLSLYLQGIEKGGLSLFLLLVFACSLFFIPNNPFAFVEYSSTFKIHFLASMLAVTVLSYFYEYTTQKSYEKLLLVSRELEKITLSDFLTGLANRRKVLQSIEDEKNRYERQAQPFSIILCDIDHFKKVNDTYGHDCGDMVLKAIAEVFTASLRKVDIAARWGGEEFLVLLPMVNRQGSGVAAERLRRAVEKLEIAYENKVIRVTMSFGIATWESPVNTIDDYIKQADENLYRAKEQGRNRVIAD